MLKSPPFFLKGWERSWRVFASDFETYSPLAKGRKQGVPPRVLFFMVRREMNVILHEF